MSFAEYSHSAFRDPGLGWFRPSRYGASGGIGLCNARSRSDVGAESAMSVPNVDPHKPPAKALLHFHRVRALCTRQFILAQLFAVRALLGLLRRVARVRRAARLSSSG